MNYMASQLFNALVVEFVRTEKRQPTDEQHADMARYALRAVAVFDGIEEADYERRRRERYDAERAKSK